MLKNKKAKTIKDMVIEKQKEEDIRKKISKTKKIPEDTKIIIEQKSKVVNFFLILIEIIKIMLKVFLIIIICILSTIGGTVLFNSIMRNFFFEIVNIPFLIE